MSFGEKQKDPTRKEIPINPPARSSKDLWYSYNYQCSVAAGFSVGPDEKTLREQNNDQSPSEVERLKKQNEVKQ